MATATTTCHCESHGKNLAPKDSPVIAMIGTPNAGKSTLFNALTGSKARMGNWPGTSVDVSRGAWNTPDAIYDVIDFPGAYSLDPLSPDEQLTRDLIVDCAPEERPDAIIIVADATSLARSLYMLAQLAEQPQRIVVALTKNDVAENQGTTIDAAALSRALGIPVVALNPRHKIAIRPLADAVRSVLAQEPTQLRKVTATDPLELADARFAWVDAISRQATSTSKTARSNWTHRVDRLALHPVLGPILFLFVMWLVFQLTTTVAAPLQDALDTFLPAPCQTGQPMGSTLLACTITSSTVWLLVASLLVWELFLPLPRLWQSCS